MSLTGTLISLDHDSTVYSDSATAEMPTWPPPCPCCCLRRCHIGMALLNCLSPTKHKWLRAEAEAEPVARGLGTLGTGVRGQCQVTCQDQEL
jgi:hypothetical protein